MHFLKLIEWLKSKSIISTFLCEKNPIFRQFGRTEPPANLTEGSAEPVRSKSAEGSAEPFGSVVHYYFHYKN